MAMPRLWARVMLTIAERSHSHAPLVVNPFYSLPPTLRPAFDHAAAPTMPHVVIPYTSCRWLGPPHYGSPPDLDWRLQIAPDGSMWQIDEDDAPQRCALAVPSVCAEQAPQQQHQPGTDGRPGAKNSFASPIANPPPAAAAAMIVGKASAVQALAVQRIFFRALSLICSAARYCAAVMFSMPST